MNKIDLDYLSNIIKTCIKKLQELTEENVRLNRELKEERDKKEEAIKLIDKIEEELKKRL